MKRHSYLYAHIRFPERGDELLITEHMDAGCTQVGRRPEGRRVRVEMESLSRELHAFYTGAYPFEAGGARSEMWLELDMNSYELEHAVVRYIGNIIAARLEMRRPPKLERHCNLLGPEHAAKERKRSWWQRIGS